MRELLRPAEVCRLLGVSRSWLYQAAIEGRIPSVRLGGPEGPVRFDPEALERWLEAAQERLASARHRRRDAASSCPAG